MPGASGSDRRMHSLARRARIGECTRWRVGLGSENALAGASGSDPDRGGGHQSQTEQTTMIEVNEE